MDRLVRNRRSYRKSGSFLKIFDLILSIAIIVCGAMNIVNPKGNAELFPIICIMGSILNGTMCIKYYMRKDFSRAIALTIAAIFLAILSIITFIALWL